VRQPYEIQSGIRAGAKVAPMKVAIAGLPLRDLIAAAAWAASLPHNGIPFNRVDS
jgi:hypothetical protein